jgi:hypothetical protein
MKAIHKAVAAAALNGPGLRGHAHNLFHRDGGRGAVTSIVAIDEPSL